jgi:hypothetical protein
MRSVTDLILHVVIGNGSRRVSAAGFLARSRDDRLPHQVRAESISHILIERGANKRV